MSPRVRRRIRLESPSATRSYLIARFGAREHEVFTLIYLDNRHRLIACEELFRGTIDGASVHPREVVKGEPHVGERPYRMYGPVRSEARTA